MKKLRGNILLTITAMIWGSAFVAQSIGSDSLGAFTFNAARSLIAAVFLIPCIFVIKKIEKDPAKKKIKIDKPLIVSGVCCGIALCVASAFQQIGISKTTVGKAGFITAMYIIIVPLLSRFFGKKIQPIIWLAVAISAVGLYLLCMNEGFSVSEGDFFILLCALCFAIHILVIDYFSDKTDGVIMSCIQFFTVGVLSLVIALIFEQPRLADIVPAILPILYTGVFSSGVAYTLQIVAQKDVNPTAASLLMSLESVFAVLSGWLFLHEGLSLKEFFGCVLVFAAIIIAQIPDMKSASDEK